MPKNKFRIKRIKPVWECEFGSVYQGDCIKVMKSLKEDQFDLIISSPPYESQRSYEELDFDMEGQEWVDWMVKVFEASVRICKGISAYVIGTGITRKFKWSAVPALLMADLHRKGFCLRTPVYYHRIGIPGSGKQDDLRKDVEYIVRVTKHQGELTWSNTQACARPWRVPQSGKVSSTARRRSGLRDPVKRKAYVMRSEGKKNRKTLLHEIEAEKFEKGANPGDLIHCKVGGNRMGIGSSIAHKNEAPFPIKIPDFFIRTWCPPNGVVFDPFSGSGTTAAAAILTGRKFVVSDIRDSQIELTIKRIKHTISRKGFGL